MIVVSVISIINADAGQVVPVEQRGAQGPRNRGSSRLLTEMLTETVSVAAGGAPGGGLRQRLVEHPGGEGGHQAGLLGEREEVERGHKPEAWM